jgi:sarcosine oxidase
MWWVQPKRPDLYSMARFPCWAIERQPGVVFYGFPIPPWRPGFKVALHAPGAPDDPERPDRALHPEDEAPIRECLRRFFPDADGPVLSASVCLYDNSPDQHFIIDRHPAHRNVLIATGFSGHGFKFAPVVGAALADLAMDDGTELPVGFLGLGRLRST